MASVASMKFEARRQYCQIRKHTACSPAQDTQRSHNALHFQISYPFLNHCFWLFYIACVGGMFSDSEILPDQVVGPDCKSPVFILLIWYFISLLFDFSSQHITHRYSFVWVTSIRLVLYPFIT